MSLDDRTRGRLAGVGLVLLALLAYAPVARCGFVWDDDKYVTENEVLVAPGGLARIWTDPRATPQYYPVVHTTFWVERSLWGLDARGFHLVNVAIHGLAALALWRLLRRLALPGAWVAAAVFAVHPVGVESVAWVTERKNTLSLLLALLAAHRLLPLAVGRLEGSSAAVARERVARASPTGGSVASETAASAASVASIASETASASGASGAAAGASARDAIVEVEPPRWSGRAWAEGAALLGLGLLSKSVVCTLPAVLLVIAWWRRGRLERWQLAAFLPLLAAGAAVGLHTAHLEKVHVGASSEFFDHSRAERALIAGRAAWFYLGKLVWPHPLSFSYERWTLEPWAPAAWAWPFAAAVLVGVLWLLRDRLGRGPLAALLIYGGVLLPALGIVDVYPFKYSFVADHFQYHAMPAALALLVAAGALALRRAGEHAPRGGIAAAVLIVLAALTFRRLDAWRDEASLWRDTLERNPTSILAAGNLGARLGLDGQALLASPATEAEGRALLLESRRLLRRALPSAADRHDLHLGVVNLAATERDLGDLRAAAALWRWAAELAPGDPEWLARAGREAAQAGDEAAAKADLDAALALAPRHEGARLTLAQLLVSSADPTLRDPEAGQRLAEALCLESRMQRFEPLAVLAAARFARGDAPGAVLAATDALALARRAGRPDQVAALERDLARYRGR